MSIPIVTNGSEFQINSFGAGIRNPPVIAVLAGGDPVASWQSLGADLDSDAQIFAVNNAPVAIDDMATATEDYLTPLWHWVLMNDGDPDGDVLTIVAVDTTGTHGRVVLDSAARTLSYVPDTAFFDGLPPGVDVIDTFTYTIADPSGETSTATVVLLVSTTTSGVVLAGTEGDDVLYGSAWLDRLDGLGGNDTLFGYEEKDTLIGGAGNDVLIGGAGADQLDGGDGSDTASYRTAAVGVLASLGNPGANTGDAAGDSYIGIENLEGSGFDDVLAGNNVANDFLGGGGTDTVTYVWAGAGVVASLGNGTVGFGSGTTQTGEAAGDRYNAIEVLEGSNFNDTLFAAAGGSTLRGLDGNDTLYGLGGADLLEGGAGQDMLIGDGGADELWGGGDSDTLRGDAGADHLYGENGNDSLDGGGGIDVLDGGAGNDTYTGGGGADRFVIADLGGTDTITDFKRAQGDKIDLRSLNIDEWIGTQAFHNDAGEVRIRNAGSQWWLEGDTNGDGIADFSVALGTVQLIQSDITM